MAEFYVTYDCDGQHYLAVVSAPGRPVGLQFASRESLIEIMESLDQEWQLTSEVNCRWIACRFLMPG